MTASRKQERFMQRYSLLAILLCLAHIGPALAGGKDAKRPNIVILIADDWSYPHAGALGTKGIKTPNIDRLVKKGRNFTRAFVAAPSCSPSRAALLTGRYPHALKEGGNLWGFVPAEYVCYTDLLEMAGSIVGFTGKGWGPGSLEGSGRTRNPAGDRFKNVRDFLAARKKDQPFCYWFGSSNPHRPYKNGAGLEAGLKLDDVKVPRVWPDTKEVRSDILDYFEEVMAFDRQIGDVLQALADAGELGDTLILVLSDNGMPFPRGKATLYDLGVHVPLIASWPGRVPEDTQCNSFISYVDIAPTLLEAAGVKGAKGIQGKSFLDILTSDKQDVGRNAVYFERERHANVRKGDIGYPARAVRTEKWLYIRNFRSDRWPAGDPETHFSVGKFGDIDDGPTKQAILKLKDGTLHERDLWDLSVGKRLEDELYSLRDDPGQITNLAYNYEHLEVKNKMRAQLEVWMRATDDSRLADGGGDDRWDRYPYFGSPAGGGKKKLKNK